MITPQNPAVLVRDFKRTRRSSSRGPTSSGCSDALMQLFASRRAIAVGWMLVLWGFITHGSYGGTGDEPHYQVIAHSLAFDADIDLANNYADREVFGDRFDAGAHARPGRNGVLRPVHDIGLPLLFSPVYRAAHTLAR